MIKKTLLCCFLLIKSGVATEDIIVEQDRTQLPIQATSIQRSVSIPSSEPSFQSQISPTQSVPLNLNPEEELGIVSLYRFNKENIAIEEILNLVHKPTREIIEILQKGQYYFVSLDANDNPLFITLLPSFIHSGIIKSSLYSTPIICSYSPDFLSKHHLIKSWQIPKDNIMDSVRRVETDLRLFIKGIIKIEYNPTDKYIVSTGGHLKYNNRSYALSVLEFSNIIPAKEPTSGLNSDSTIKDHDLTVLEDRKTDLLKSALPLKCEIFEKKVQSYTFEKGYNYLENDVPTTIHPIVGLLHKFIS